MKGGVCPVNLKQFLRANSNQITTTIPEDKNKTNASFQLAPTRNNKRIRIKTRSHNEIVAKSSENLKKRSLNLEHSDMLKKCNNRTTHGSELKPMIK